MVSAAGLAGALVSATGLALLIAAGLLLVKHEVGQSELRPREQILRLECRLAERIAPGS